MAANHGDDKNASKPISIKGAGYNIGLAAEIEFFSMHSTQNSKKGIFILTHCHL